MNLCIGDTRSAAAATAAFFSSLGAKAARFTKLAQRLRSACEAAGGYREAGIKRWGEERWTAGCAPAVCISFGETAAATARCHCH